MRSACSRKIFLPLVFVSLGLARAAFGQADLGVTITDAPDPVTPGSNITYTITAVNSGPAAADTVALSLSPIPLDTELVSVTPGAGGSCQPDEAFCTFSGSTGVGQQRSITVVVKVDPETSPDDLIEATAVVSAASPDLNTANNSASTTTRVGAPLGADLSVTKNASVSSAQPGGAVTYTIVVSNAGPAAAVNALLRETLPTGLVLVSTNVASGWSCVPGAGGTIECSKGLVAVAEAATFTIATTVAQGTSGNVTNTATITSATSDGNGGNNSATATVTVRAGTCTATPARLVPIVLDVDTGVDHFTTELALTNRGTTNASLTLRYTAALGSGTGTVNESLPAGRQLIIPDVIAYLRQKGLQIPPVAQGQQGGTLLVTFNGVTDSATVNAIARTTAAVTLPVGAAGLAYAGVDPCEGLTGTSYIFGARSTSNDRTNVAVFNPGDQPVTVKISVVSGDPLIKRTVVVRESLTLDAFGWSQVTRILDGTGVSNGYVIIERISAGGSYGAYGVINNNFTGDGSFLLPVAAGSGAPFPSPYVTNPVLVETQGATPFRSELVLSNKGAAEIDLTLTYFESLDGATKGTGGSITESLAAGEQKILANAIDYLRDEGIPIGAEGAASYAGSLRVTWNGNLSDVAVGARTAAQSGFLSGGEFGLFTPGIYPGQEATTEAFLYGLQANLNNRSNVAVLHAGEAGSGAITLELQAFDGDAAGAPRGTPDVVPLQPGGWTQIGNFLRNKGVSNGWVRVRRTAGSAPWITYGVVNDGGNPGERTGDGAFVPMTK